MSESCCNPKYLVLHFLNGELIGTAVTRTWRGALMSKRNHEHGGTQHLRHVDLATRIIPIEAVLAIRGLEKPETGLTADDLVWLEGIGILKGDDQ